MSYKLNLKHRGDSIICGIDLFDECHYGADKLFLRGHFCCPDAVREQIKICLGDTEKLDFRTIAYEHDLFGTLTQVTPELEEKIIKLTGIGNPLTLTPESGDLTKVPTIALNRYYIPNKKFWNNNPPIGIKNPYKASAAVTFTIRLYFRDDYAYITFGCPWSAVMDESKDETPTIQLSTAEDFINNFRLFKCHFISKEDAIQVLSAIFPNFGQTTTEVSEVLPLYDETGSLIEL